MPTPTDRAMRTPRPPSPAQDDLTALTYNFGNHGRYADLTTLVSHARQTTPGRWGLCLQEVGDQDDTLERLVDETRVRLVRGPKGMGRSKVAIVLPTKAKVEDWSLIPMTPRKFVGPHGAGGVFTDAKYLLTARANPRRGPSYDLASFHFISSVEGRWAPWKPRRRALWRTQAEVTRKWLQADPFAGVANVLATRTFILGSDHRAVAYTVRASHAGDGVRLALGDSNAQVRSDLMQEAFGGPHAIHMASTPSHGGRGRDKRAIDVLLAD